MSQIVAATFANAVGIRTSAPSAPLTVVAQTGSVFTNGMLLRNPNNVAGNDATLCLQTGGAAGGYPAIAWDGTTGLTWMMGTHPSSGNIHLSVGNTNPTAAPVLSCTPSLVHIKAQLLANNTVTFTGNLQVAGATTLNGPLSANTATVANAATFQSTLQVVGATTLNGPLSAGTVTVASTLQVAGATTLNGPLSANTATVANAATFQSTLQVAGATTLNGPLSAGTVTVASTLQAFGPATFANAATFQGSVQVAGATTLNGALSANTVTVANSLTSASLNAVTSSAPGVHVYDGTRFGADLGVATSNGLYSASASAGDAVLRATGGGRLLVQTGTLASAVTVNTDNSTAVSLLRLAANTWHLSDSDSATRLYFSPLGRSYFGSGDGTFEWRTNANGAAYVTGMVVAPASMGGLYVYGGGSFDLSGTNYQAQLALKGGIAANSVYRCQRIDMYNVVTNANTPQWTMINDYNQNGTNGLWFVKNDTTTAVLQLGQKSDAQLAGRKFYQYYSTIVANTVSTIKLSYTSNAHFSRVVAHLWDQTNTNNVSVLTCDAAGGNSQGGTATSTMAVWNININGPPNAYPWSTTVATANTTLTIQPAYGSPGGYNYAVFVEVQNGTLSSMAQGGATVYTFSV